MPMPLQYLRASAEFDALVEDLRQSLGHESRHQTYQTLESVLRVFRRRLAVGDAIAFANALPAVARAIFVADWDTEAQVRPFADRETMTREVRAFREHHDFSPETAIRDAAAVLRRHVDEAAFDRVLSRLPAGAAGFWADR